MFHLFVTLTKLKFLNHVEIMHNALIFLKIFKKEQNNIPIFYEM